MPTRFRRLLPALAASACVFAATPPAIAGTYLSNSQFSGDLSGWTPMSGGAVQWSSLDVDDSPWSGSALLHNAEPVAGRVDTLHQCVQLSYPGHYRLKASGRLATGTADAALVVGYYVRFSNDCTGGYVAGGGRFLSRDDGWEHVAIPIRARTAVSVEIRLSLDKDIDGGSASGWLDDVYLDITPLLMRDGFE